MTTTQAANEQKYNGWANRETWLVSLWVVDNDDFSREVQDAFGDDATQYDVKQMVMSMIFEMYEQSRIDGMLSDLLDASLARVDWKEIYDAVTEK